MIRAEMIKRGARLRIEAILDEINEDDRPYQKGFADGYIAALVDFTDLKHIDGMAPTRGETSLSQSIVQESRTLGELPQVRRI